MNQSFLILDFSQILFFKMPSLLEVILAGFESVRCLMENKIFHCFCWPDLLKLKALLSNTIAHVTLKELLPSGVALSPAKNLKED